jgi:hypothetical protein
MEGLRYSQNRLAVRFLNEVTGYCHVSSSERWPNEITFCLISGREREDGRRVDKWEEKTGTVRGSLYNDRGLHGQKFENFIRPSPRDVYPLNTIPTRDLPKPDFFLFKTE